MIQKVRPDVKVTNTRMEIGPGNQAVGVAGHVRGAHHAKDGIRTTAELNEITVTHSGGKEVDPGTGGTNPIS